MAAWEGERVSWEGGVGCCEVRARGFTSKYRTSGSRIMIPYAFTCTKRLALSIDLPSDERRSLAQIERAEKHRLEPIAMQKPSMLNEVSDRDETPTPATIGRSERNTSSGTFSSDRKSTVRTTVAIGSPACHTRATVGINRRESVHQQVRPRTPSAADAHSEGFCGSLRIPHKSRLVLTVAVGKGLRCRGPQARAACSGSRLDGVDK